MTITAFPVPECDRQTDHAVVKSFAIADIADAVTATAQ